MMNMGIWTNIVNSFIEELAALIAPKDEIEKGNIKLELATWFNEEANRILRESQKSPYTTYITAYKKQHNDQSPKISPELMASWKEHAFQEIASAFKQQFMELIASNFFQVQQLVNGLVTSAIEAHKNFSPIQSEVVTLVIQEKKRYKEETGEDMTSEKVSQYSQKAWAQKAEEYDGDSEISMLIALHRGLQRDCREKHGACGQGKTLANVGAFKQATERDSSTPNSASPKEKPGGSLIK